MINIEQWNMIERVGRDGSREIWSLYAEHRGIDYVATGYIKNGEIVEVVGVESVPGNNIDSNKILEELGEYGA